jgi:hypothetical protein
MSKIEARNLGDSGRAYLRRQLTGVNGFCSELLAAINAVPGEVLTFAPSETTLERLLRFEEGGLLPENLTGLDVFPTPGGGTLVPIVSLIDKQVEIIREAMTIASAVCIADDVNPRWSDELVRSWSTAFGVGEEVYHLLTLMHSNDDFEDVVCCKSFWHDVSAVCTLSPSLDEARTSTPLELEKSAATAVLITCAAYAGEGFVLWRRTAA